MYNEPMRYRSLIFRLLFILTACGPKATPNPSIQIDQAVAATLAAMPAPTSAPVSTPYPSPTPADLRGLFCEYQFCIGHPADMAFYDVSAVTSNQGTPSAYQMGFLTAYSSNLVIQVRWQLSPGAADPQPMLDQILESGIDTKVGTPEVKLVRNMNVIYTAITTTATTVLPYGGAAAWTCGERIFAWKVYTPDQTSASGLFESALARFNCNR